MIMLRNVPLLGLVAGPLVGYVIVRIHDSSAMALLAHVARRLKLSALVRARATPDGTGATPDGTVPGTPDGTTLAPYGAPGAVRFYAPPVANLSCAVRDESGHWRPRTADDPAPVDDDQDQDQHPARRQTADPKVIVQWVKSAHARDPERWTYWELVKEVETLYGCSRTTARRRVTDAGVESTR